MKAIYKYTLGDDFGEQHVDIPIGARSLHAAEQHGQIRVWALVDTEMPATPYRFVVLPTGTLTVRDPGRHLSTFMLHGGVIVVHVFVEEP